MSKFKVGDVVQLNSGGPGMTVREIVGDEYTCNWFSEGNLARQDHFREAMLQFDLLSATHRAQQVVEQLNDKTLKKLVEATKRQKK